ncbi:MAG: prepilin-type N-terminal cleavage/methylation domain-containing protein [Chloroflexi bacterium]|nr:MAG: prepilin-type N-terminal cleavage/methylation domain-containing protein [Chloroflexota bacterium]
MSVILNNHNRKTSGFTIVELLIVIVVIGILAAITIVSFNGIQNRAKATQSQSLAKDVSKKAQIFYAYNSRYPTIAEFSASTTPQEVKLPAGVTLYSYSAGYTDRHTIDWTKSVAYCVSPTGGAEVTWWDYARAGDYKFSNDVGKSFTLGDISGGC